ncbi:MAG: histidine kinase [Sphingobacterium sp.]|jgi:sensor histidine kinase YesM|nr:histidine kinase [Sphingobacterium sp.]
MNSILFTRESLYVQIRIWPIYFVLSLLINYHLGDGEVPYLLTLLKLTCLIVFFNLAMWMMYRFYLKSLSWTKIMLFIGIVWLLVELINWIALDLLPMWGLYVIDSERLAEKERLYWELANKILSMMLFVTALVLQVFYKKSAADYRRESEQRLQLELEAKDLQLQQLMEQIFPHLTFNVLHDIKEECKTIAPGAAGQMQCLSDLLRYCMRQVTMGNTVVLVDREMEAVDWFLKLRVHRLSDCQVDYKIHGESWGQKIPPTILLVLLENAFKYGVKNRVDDPIRVELFLLDDRLEFYCRNAVDGAAITKPATGQGLCNCAKRLAILFPEKHIFDYGLDGDHFMVKLIIYQN